MVSRACESILKTKEYENSLLFSYPQLRDDVSSFRTHFLSDASMCVFLSFSQNLAAWLSTCCKKTVLALKELDMSPGDTSARGQGLQWRSVLSLEVASSKGSAVLSGRRIGVVMEVTRERATESSTEEVTLQLILEKILTSE